MIAFTLIRMIGMDGRGAAKSTIILLHPNIGSSFEITVKAVYYEQSTISIFNQSSTSGGKTRFHMSGM